MEVHQFLAAASPGDPVTHSALQIRSLLRRSGSSDIFACRVHDELAGGVLRLEEYTRRFPSRRGAQNILVYHVAGRAPEVSSLLLHRSERLVLVHHVVTEDATDVAAFRDRADLALAVSAYLASHLEAVGYQDARVSPLVWDVGWLSAVEPQQQTTAHLEEYLHGPLVLFVGELLPHSRLDLLIQAYHVLVTYLLPEAYLAMVGPSPVDRYRHVIESYVRGLNLTQAWIPGQLAPAELAAFFRAAGVFTALSEHGGICVPLLHAFAFDVPVVARAVAAIPETLADAGVILPAEEDPFLLAEALARVLTDDMLRKDLVTAGSKRLRYFDPESTGATFLAHLSGLA